VSSRPIDRTVVVDGRRTDVRVTGSGGPPVVMVSSSGGRHEQWDQVRDRLDPIVMCMTYARPGLDGSDPLAENPSGGVHRLADAAHHLRTVLRAADLEPPYVLVGCSVGGWINDRYATLWPGEVAGMVQVDATYLAPIPRTADPGAIDEAGGRGFVWRFADGFAELHANPPMPRPTRAAVLSRAFGTIPPEIVRKHWKPLTPEEADLGWRECQRAWARRLDAIHIAADTGGHHIQIDQPELVAHVIYAVVQAVREDRDLQLKDEAVQHVRGRILRG
jgi:pimeloyl-ACP methyl ester carboxylesterase